jgi:hypothetical protein
MGRATRTRLLTAVLAALLVGPVALVARPAPAAAALPPVSLIGDSTLLGMTTSAKAIVTASYNALFEARSCRRLIITSCRGRGVIPPNTIQTMRNYAGRLGDAVVIMAGYDDWYNFDVAVDTIVAEAKRQGLGHVVWLTYRAVGPYVGVGGAYSATYRAFNAILAQKARQHPELTIADWHGYSAAQPSWFSSDGIHLSRAGATALGGFLKSRLDGLGLQRCYGGFGGTPRATPAPVAISQTAPGSFTASARRVADTRPGGTDPHNLPIAAGRSLDLPLRASGQVPAGATSVVVNVTAVNACSAGFATAYPCGPSVPLASNLNVPIRRTRAALATVMLNGAGELCVYTSATTDLLVDLLGWFGPSGQRVNPTRPDRLLDTRNGNGARNRYVGKVGTTPLAVTVTGVGPVSPQASSVLVNVTAVGPDFEGFFQVFPCGTVPSFSNLNYRAGQVVANAAISGVDGAGRICLKSSSPTPVIVDILGWFGAAGQRVQAQTPQRLVDTRNGQGGVRGPLPAGGIVNFPVPGTGLLATVTIVGAAATGFATAYPCGARPNASNVNYVAGDIRPNLAQIGPGTGGRGCVFTSASAHVLVDRAATLVP